MRAASQVGIFGAVGVIAGLAIWSFIGQDAPRSLSAVADESEPVAARDSATAQDVPNANSPQQAVGSATVEESLVPAERNAAFVSTIPPPIDQPSIVEVSSYAAAAAAPVPVSNEDWIAAESGSGAGNSTERPLGWCFRTWIGQAGPWLVISPPGEPTYELRSDSSVVWNGSRSAWLGTEDQTTPPHFRAAIMWQTIDAEPYRGSRVELSAQFRDRAGIVLLFLRTQRATETELVLMGAPPHNLVFSGFRDSWVRFPVVADVPRDADVIVFGVAVGNRGHAWIDDMRLTKVARSTPLTNNPLGGGERFTMPLAPAQPFGTPTNLDFEATNLDPTDLPLEAARC